MTMTADHPTALLFAELTADLEDAAAIAAEGQAATRTRDEARELCRHVRALLRAADARLDRIGYLIENDDPPRP